MRTAPCPTAPALRANGSDIVLTSADSFTFPDLNSWQRSACGQYGLASEDKTTCWIQIVYNGITGWVPRAVATDPGGYPDALCNTFSDFPSDQEDLLVTSSAVLSSSCVSCFPGNAMVLVRGGTSLPMSELQLGDEVREE